MGCIPRLRLWINLWKLWIVISSWVRLRAGARTCPIQGVEGRFGGRIV
jgi:hypothetical protein